MRFRLYVVALVSAAAGAPFAWASEAPDFQEVYELVRSHLGGRDKTALNRAAVDGLLKELHPQVTLLENGSAATANAPAGPPGLLNARVLEQAWGYFRVGQVRPGLEKGFYEAYQKMSSTNRLKGLVLDLRFAGGQDYGAALATGDWFFASEQPLLDWGDGVQKSTVKENAIGLPVMVLVNSKTAAAAEGLAGMLRQSRLGLLVGASTAGQASKFKEFPLKNGQRLRIATAPVKLGDGQPLPTAGLSPDIPVQVTLEEEQVYWEDPYTVLSKGSRAANPGSSATNNPDLAETNRTLRRVSEAELVRMHREGREPDAPAVGVARRAAESARPVLQDPILVRALDVLRGLAIVQPARPRSS